jgi:hypothetical protein
MTRDIAVEMIELHFHPGISRLLESRNRLGLELRLHVTAQAHLSEEGRTRDRQAEENHDDEKPHVTGKIRSRSYSIFTNFSTKTRAVEILFKFKKIFRGIGIDL